MFDSIQSCLLDRAKQQLDPRLSIVDELSELLDLSKDSIYRRMRGETELSLKESLIICEEYGISLHELVASGSSLITFQGRLVERKTYDIYLWMQSILEQLKMLDSFQGEKQMIYYTKDLPIFYYFNHPRLSAFKIYFWMRTIHRYTEFEQEAFTFDQVPQELVTLGQRIWQKFCHVPSIEIWAQETTVVTLKQIEYYFECGYFKNPDDALLILDEFEELLRETKEWMKAGTKPDGSSLQIYRNDILIGDNTILFRLGDERVAFLPIGNLSIISTTNPTFTAHIESFMDTVLQRAVLISATGEKERNKYFNQNVQLINNLRKRLGS